MGNLRDSSSRDSNFFSQTHPKQELIANDQDFYELRSLMSKFEKKYGITSKELIQAVKEPSIQIPLSIYSNKELSALESSVKYLKEDLNLSYREISKIIDRDERTVWVTYNNSKKKFLGNLNISSEERLPIQVIKDRDYGILESITAYLKEKKGLKYSQIGKLLARDQRTIWTCYNRFKKKRGEGK